MILYIITHWPSFHWLYCPVGMSELLREAQLKRPVPNCPAVTYSPDDCDNSTLFGEEWVEEFEDVVIEEGEVVGTNSWESNNLEPVLIRSLFIAAA